MSFIISRFKLHAESGQDYVIKPFSANELRAQVRSLIITKRTRDELQKELATQNEDLSRLAMKLLAFSKAKGIEIRNCPSYGRE